MSKQRELDSSIAVARMALGTHLTKGFFMQSWLCLFRLLSYSCISNNKFNAAFSGVHSYQGRGRRIYKVFCGKPYTVVVCMRDVTLAVVFCMIGYFVPFILPFGSLWVNRRDTLCWLLLRSHVIRPSSNLRMVMVPPRALPSCTLAVVKKNSNWSLLGTTVWKCSWNTAT